MNRPPRDAVEGGVADDAERPDAALLGLVANQERWALAALYDRYGTAVFGWARQRLRDTAEAEEVVQEVFLRVWTRAGGFDPERGEAGGWLFSITRNACTDRLRRGQRDRATQVIARDDTGQPPPGGPVVPAAEETAERAWLGGLTRAAVTHLSVEHRQIVELCYFEHLTQTEAASRLGIPLGTVKSRTFHALRQLRGVLDGWGVHEPA